MIAERLASIRQEMARACAQAGRSPDEVQLIAVSKTFPVQDIVQAKAAGQQHFGESYAQELRDKARELPDLTWHFIGRLQTNKAKYVAPRASRVHALETVEQAEALARRAPDTLRCLVSVNVGGEDSKGGVRPSDALDRCAALTRVPGIEIVGLMCLPPFTEDPEDASPWFAELADLAARGRARGLPLTELSMGMSHDFPVAIRHGATWIRVGTAIFGSRSRS